MTNSRVYAGRVTYQPEDLQLLDKPVVFGMSYATDIDGVDTQAGTIGEEQKAIAADAGWLVFGDAATLFVEIGQLVDYSRGGMTGIKGKLLGFVDYQLDYRMFGSQFVPGYFNYQYEVNPIDLKNVNSGRITGYHGNLGFSLGQMGYFLAEYQNLIYETTKKEEPSLKAVLTLNEISGVSAQARYEQLQMRSLSDAGKNGANIVVDSFVPLAMMGIAFPGKAKVTWKRTYTQTAKNGEFEDSTEIGYLFSLPFGL